MLVRRCCSLGFASLLPLAAAIAGCTEDRDATNVAVVEDSGTGSGEAEASSETGNSSDVSGVKAGFARGRVTMPDGSPVTIPGAKITLFLVGVTESRGENVQLSPRVGPEGTYEQELVPGEYHFSDAMIEVPFGGETYRLDLDPVGDMHLQRASRTGIQQDFVWRITGQKPGTAGKPEQAPHWYGAHLAFQFAIYREDVKQAFPLPEPGTKFTLQLTPQGPLIDGSTGETLTFEREWTADLTVTSTLTLHDLPIGDYRLTGEILAPDGTRTAAVFDDGFAKYSPAVEVHFPPKLLTNSTEPQLRSVGAALP